MQSTKYFCLSAFVLALALVIAAEPWFSSYYYPRQHHVYGRRYQYAHRPYHYNYYRPQYNPYRYGFGYTVPQYPFYYRPATPFTGPQINFKNDQNQLLEFFIYKIKPGVKQHEFEAARRRAVSKTLRQKGVLAAAEFQALYRPDFSGLNPLTEEDQPVFMGMYLYENQEAFNSVLAVVNSTEYEDYIKTFDVECFKLTKSLDGSPLNIKSFPFSPQLVGVVMEKVKEGKKDEFEKITKKHFDNLFTLNRFSRPAGQYEQHDDPNSRVTAAFFRNKEELAKEFEDPGENFEEWHKTFDYDCHYVFKRIY